MYWKPSEEKGNAHWGDVLIMDFPLYFTLRLSLLDGDQQHTAQVQITAHVYLNCPDEIKIKERYALNLMINLMNNLKEIK